MTTAQTRHSHCKKASSAARASFSLFTSADPFFFNAGVATSVGRAVLFLCFQTVIWRSVCTRNLPSSYIHLVWLCVCVRVCLRGERAGGVKQCEGK